MSIKKLNPYLNFDGKAEQAIAFYQGALGAKISGTVMRFGDGPAEAGPVAPENKNRVMHASLEIGGGTIMLSDTMPGMPTMAGSNTHVMLDFEDDADAARKFDALAAGGRVGMPFQDAFWGAKFGMLVDQFGISWMFNCEMKKS